MTFYNVLSALLFLGSLRVLLLSLEGTNWPTVFASACLSILVFNDMLSAAHEVETTAEIKYTLPLMLIDLWNFLLLALATIVISPNANLFDVPLPNIAAFLTPDSFWVMLLLYWLSLIGWTHVAKRGLGDQTRGVRIWQWTVAMVFLAEWLVHVFGLPKVAGIGRVVVLSYLILYLTVVRPLAWRYAKTAS